MGNLEKLVVLTVFFLAGVVLAVSMNSGSPALAGDTPAEDLGRRVDRSALGGSERTAALGPETPAEPTAASRAQGSEPSEGAERATPPAGGPRTQRELPPLLSATAERASEGSTAAAPDGLLRVEAEGLEPTLSERFHHYTCRPGDTFAALALRFYGATEYAAALRRSNEGVDVLEAGTLLTVPRDARSTPTRTVAAPPQPVRRGVPTPAPEPTVTAAEDADGELGTEFREHVVGKGDNLSRVAERYYGDRNLWRRVFDANRDQLENPDQLQPGMVLRIP